MSAPRIRPLTPADRAAVGAIAYETGFFGESAARYFPARALFELLWAGPYFSEAGATGFVAERGGEVLGYIVGFTDERLYRRALLRTVVRGLGRAWPPTRELWPTLHYLARAALFPGPHADPERYPAHLHLNLLAASRGLRLGDALLGAYLAELTRRGVPGVQLSTTSENRAALGLYRKHGFEAAARRITPLWTPWLGHPAEHVVMVRALGDSK